MKCKKIMICFCFVLLLNIVGCATLSKTELTQAASKGDIARVQVLINQGANINEVDKNKHTPLMHAIFKGQTQAAKALVTMGANINMQDKDAYPALFHAISYGNVEVAKVLLEKGADLNLKDQSGYSCLHLAASHGRSEIAKMLLKNKININERNHEGETPLHLALSNRMYETAKLLIDSGADINARDNYGSTPLHYAIKYGYVSRNKKLMNDYVLSKNQDAEITSQVMLDYILNRNPNMGVRDSSGYTPLGLALYYKDKDMTDALLNKSSSSEVNEELTLSEGAYTGLRYKVINQTAAASGRIKNAAEFKVRDIDYSAINAKELGYSSDEEWKVEKKDIPKTFAESLSKLARKEGIENKKIIMLKHKETANDGIVIEVAVQRIMLNWNYAAQKPDVYLCDINFTDYRNGQKLFSGIVIITTIGEGEMRVGSMRTTHSGRFSAGVSFSIPVNPGMPGWEGSFNGRLHIAAYNMAWVITKIMLNGEIASSAE